MATSTLPAPPSRLRLAALLGVLFVVAPAGGWWLLWGPRPAPMRAFVNSSDGEVRILFWGPVPAMDTVLPVWVEHRVGGVYQGGRSELVRRGEGHSVLTLAPGDYVLRIGARKGPDRRPPFYVPTVVSVKVVGGGSVEVPAELREGGATVVPRSLGVPGAPAGRLRVLCRQGTRIEERRTAIGSPPDHQDMIYPHLPPGTWDLEFLVGGGKSVRARAEVRVGEVTDAR